MKKRIVLQIAAVIFGVLIVLTFASRTIYGLSLPVVHVVEPQFDTVPVTARTTGTMDSKTATDILAEKDWIIDEVHINNGDYIKAGDLLFTINITEFELYEGQLGNQIEDIEIRIKVKALEILRLENRINAIPASSIRNSGTARRNLAELTAELEILLLQLKQTQTQLEQIKTKLDSFYYPPGGEIYAPINGTVYNLAVSAGNHPEAGKKLLSILPENAPLTVNFRLDSKEGIEFGPDDPISVSFYTMIEMRVREESQTQSQTQPQEQHCNTAISSRRLSDDGHFWEYEAFIDTYTGTPLMGIDISVTVGHSGKFYSLVVPAAAVSEGRYGPRVFVIQSRPGLFGEEFFIMEASVTVPASNNFVAAIDLPGGMHYEIVTYTSHPIIDGDIVRVVRR